MEPEQKYKKILITGVAGFIGYHLSRSLMENGYEVFGIDSMNGYYSTQIKHDRIELLRRSPNFGFSAVNICQRTDLEGLFAANKFDMVIHLAAQAGVRYSLDAPHKYAESNLIGFVNVIEACRQHGISKFLFASSSSVYGNRSDGPFSENGPTDEPESLYAATKKANELMAYSYAKQFGMQTIGLRFFSVYGPWGRPDMAYFSFTKKILKGETIPVFNKGEMVRDFTYIDDIVAGVHQLIDRLDLLPSYRIYNLGNNHPVKIMDFIQALEAAIGQKAQIDYLPMQAGDVIFTCADISAAQRDFGYNPGVDLQEGLNQFMIWYNDYFLDGRLTFSY
ncbi:dTDP-glucose 4,6-dehydratase [Geofilum rubicundum JCM 15548]|uniref:dTDP-glucose 4,6-dehydratase n=1 Tax=Geofilum rubicundum JCM 15548 TaxID=1236989 RepID=A0A0E9LTS9_9BACT|nr:dTDP-glucose 4,6-dehydratase [Geofilum rubicundum JCM 15548]